MAQRIHVVFVLPLICAWGSQTTDSTCQRYGLQRTVFPASVYRFQDSDLAVVLRFNRTEDDCGRACLMDPTCGGLLHDSNSSLYASTEGLCVLVPMETLGQEEKVSRGNRSADGPPAGVSSFAKVCRVSGNKKKPHHEAESKGTDWARVNYILNIYGGVTLGLGTLMIIVAVFLYRKPPARDISMKYVSDQHQMMMMGGRQSGHGSSIHRFIRRGSRSGSRSFLPEHSQNVLRTSSSVFSSGTSAFGRPSASGVDTMSEVSSVATDTLSEASSSMAPSTVMSVSHVRGMHGQAGPGVYYL